jgi:hypothetical protein
MLSECYGSGYFLMTHVDLRQKLAGSTIHLFDRLAFGGAAEAAESPDIFDCRLPIEFVHQHRSER